MYNKKIESFETTTALLTPEDTLAQLIKQQQAQIIEDQQGLIKENVNKMLAGLVNDFVNNLKKVPIFDRAINELSNKKPGFFTILMIIILVGLCVFFVPWIILIALNIVFSFLLIYLNVTKCKNI